MSLLATKSWNPRSGKNRARVERDEAEFKVAEQKMSARAQQSEAEWQYDRLKQTSVMVAAPRVGEVQPISVEVPKSSEIVPNAATEDSAIVSSKKHTHEGSSDGNQLGGASRQLKAWYEYEEYVIPSNKKGSISDARDTHRRDPLTLIADIERASKERESVAHESSRVKVRSSPYDGGGGGKTLLQKLRDERLERERIEKEKAMKLVGTGVTCQLVFRTR